MAPETRDRKGLEMFLITIPVYSICLFCLFVYLFIRFVYLFTLFVYSFCLFALFICLFYLFIRFVHSLCLFVYFIYLFRNHSFPLDIFSAGVIMYVLVNHESLDLKNHTQGISIALLLKII
jgi:hypothetical protein